MGGVARYKRRRFQEAAQSSNLIGKIGRLSRVGDITFRGGIAGKVPSLARPACRISENQCPSLTSVPLKFFWWLKQSADFFPNDKSWGQELSADSRVEKIVEGILGLPRFSGFADYIYWIQ